MGFKICLELTMLAHTFSSSVQEAEAGGFKASLIYLASSRIGGTV